MGRKNALTERTHALERPYFPLVLTFPAALGFAFALAEGCFLPARLVNEMTENSLVFAYWVHTFRGTSFLETVSRDCIRLLTLYFEVKISLTPCFVSRPSTFDLQSSIRFLIAASSTFAWFHLSRTTSKDSPPSHM